MWFYSLLFCLLLPPVTASKDLHRCCSTGRQTFVNTLSCSKIRIPTKTRGHQTQESCRRSADVCCLRELIDSSCKDGKISAQRTNSCPAQAERGEEVYKECCECCLLGQDMYTRTGGCETLKHFGYLCNRTFHGCCESMRINSPHNSVPPLISIEGDRNPPIRGALRPTHAPLLPGTEEPTPSSAEGINRPASAPTALPPTIIDTGDGSPNADDVQYVVLNTATVRPPELSITTPVTGLGNRLQDGPRYDRCLGPDNPCEHLCVDDGEEEVICGCRTGYKLRADAHTCDDVDECLMQLDHCLDTQRCINTVGSFKCIRILSCGTGYYLDSKTEECVDIDECALGTHDCGRGYTCRNTAGSFRCEHRMCPPGTTLNLVTNDCDAVTCDEGMTPDQKGGCKDIDECGLHNACQTKEVCINTIGSFRCEQPTLACEEGFYADPERGCVDVDECEKGTHRCHGSTRCINIPGSYRCDCPEGYSFNTTTKTCGDLDECLDSAGRVCSPQSKCVNTIGSFTCQCRPGFLLASDGHTCEDVDECATGRAVCQQRCINVPGSYQCICDRGYTLSSDGKTCVDIDECRLWSTYGNSLCMGRCINTPGSFKCECPPGYQLSRDDSRTCEDVDECKLGYCQGNERICVNLLGSYKCVDVQCPENFIHDPQFKNRCNRKWPLCSQGDVLCQELPIAIYYNHIGVPGKLRLDTHGIQSIPLFTMRGPQHPATDVEFELILRDAVTGQIKSAGNGHHRAPGIGHHATPARRDSFLLQKGGARNTVVISMRESIDGPQVVHLDLMMRITHDSVYAGKAVAKLAVHVSEDDQRHPTTTVLLPQAQRAKF